MNEKHVVEDLLAYVSNNLDRASAERVKNHLAGCGQCTQELEGMTSLWNRLGKLPEEQPDESSRVRFYDMLKGYEQGVRQSVVVSHQQNFLKRFLLEYPAFQYGFAVMLVAIGLVCGYVIKPHNDNNSVEIARLRDDVRSMNRLLTVSLLQQQSASERLRGVSMSYKMNNPDPEIVSALLNTLKYDPNTNVRLAALDVLSREVDRPAIRHELINTLPLQAPLVQIALVDLLVQFNDKESRDALRQTETQPNLNRDVKKRIESGIQQML